MARICLIRQFYVPFDARVRREVEALVQEGHQVDVICLRGRGEPCYERRGQTTYWRVPLAHRRTGLRRQLFEYATFFLAAAALVTLLHLRRKYDVVQVNSMPDALVFSALIPRMLGARVLLDLHECMPEFFSSKYGSRLDSRAPRLVAALEQAAIRYADHTITCTDQMAEVFVRRGAARQKLTVILNGADEDVFDPDRFPPRDRPSGQFHLISHGAVERRYGLDTVIRAVGMLQDEIPGLRLTIIGEGSHLEELRDLSDQLGLSQRVLFRGFGPVQQLVQALSEADAGVVAIKPDIFRDLTLCNKMYDFISMRKPVIVARTRSVQAYFSEDCFSTFNGGDHQDLARAIRELYCDRDLCRRKPIAATEANAAHRWPRQRVRYLAVVARLRDRGMQRRNPVGGAWSRVVEQIRSPRKTLSKTEREQRLGFLVNTYPGEPTVGELARQAEAGKRPRKDYVELARLLGAEVIDSHHLASRGLPLARVIGGLVNLPLGQVCEVFLRSRRYRTIFAWSDRLGLPLALLLKMTFSRRTLILYSAWLSRPKKAVFLRRLKVQSHLAAVLNYSSVQMDFAAAELAVPAERLHLALQPVDDRFWTPQPGSGENLICSVGWEARDYATLVEAMRELELDVQIAVGISGLSSSTTVQRSVVEPRARSDEFLTSFQALRGTYSYRLQQEWFRQLGDEGTASNVKVRWQLEPEELRELYRRSRFVVVPLLDVDSDCGVTTVTEAMAMAKAVVITRTRGQVDIIRDGEHGVYVPPGDAVALRSVIEHLLHHPEEAERMGRAGRAAIEGGHTMDSHVVRLARIIAAASDMP